MSALSIPALVAAALMVLMGVGAAWKPSSLSLVGVTATSALGTSEIRAVFGGMFIALGTACLLLGEPIVFAVVGSAWLADVAVRIVSVFGERVPVRQSAPVLAIGLAMGAALLSGYWFA